MFFLLKDVVTSHSNNAEEKYSKMFKQKNLDKIEFLSRDCLFTETLLPVSFFINFLFPFTYCGKSSLVLMTLID